jgi:hypothetical protein
MISQTAINQLRSALPECKIVYEGQRLGFYGDEQQVV